jgi:thioredoxin 1
MHNKMRLPFSIILLITAVVFSNCNSDKRDGYKIKLTAPEFAERIKEDSSFVLLDVRTPDEFLKGHLQEARNINWGGKDFEQQIKVLNKSQPVFVYCLSGGRSSAAADNMRSNGFKHVYELEGGIMKWRAANLPEVNNTSSLSTGMTKQEFESLLVSDKLVLVDFYADWCAPCKKMKPYLDEISNEMADKVIVLRINADDHQALCKQLKIDALPVLHIYQNEKLIWDNTGYIDKEDVVKQLL